VVALIPNVTLPDLKKITVERVVKDVTQAKDADGEERP
jgi:FKBP-type peptidyl-prolyl cis-trans isomerase (trigger factor)